MGASAPDGSENGPLRVLWIATKTPWPPRDGGRLLQWLTLEALAAEGVEITLVAPIDPAHEEAAEIGEALRDRVHPVLVSEPPRGRLARAARVLGRGLPWTVAAHDRPAVRRQVDVLLAESRFDAVHSEQIQSWPQTAPARDRGVPVVLRTQNVESDLWRQVAEISGLGPPIRWAFRWQSKRLARWEGEVVRRASAAIALTREDADRLSALAEGREVTRVAAPFPERLPTGAGALEGRPPLVLFGSGGWLPNRDSERWFLRQIWPAVLRAEPAARLHVLGGEGTGGAGEGTEEDGVVRHPAPRDSRDAYVSGSLLVVPVRIASGVRMKILEAWARGIPVLATPEAAAGLDMSFDAGEGCELLLFRDASELVSGLRRLRDDPGLCEAMVTAARSRLAQDHEPQRVARDLIRLYRAGGSERPEGPAQPVTASS